MIKKLALKFNRASDHSFNISANKSFLAFSFVAGLVAMPLSTTAGLLVMAAPAIYAGFGVTSKGVAKGLEYIAPAT